MTPRTRAGIVLTAEDTSGPGFASFRRNLAGAQAQVSTVSSQVGSMAGKFGTIGVALAAAFSGASLKGAVDLGDQLDDLSEKTGIAVGELSALRYAGEVTGTPLEALAGGVKKLSTTMTEAAGGAKEQGKLFDALGISVRNMDGSLKGSDKMLGELADKFASFADGPAKAALAVKLFGKAGADMIPLLNQGSRGLAELRKEAEALGVVVGGDFARASAAFNDNLRRISLSAEGVKVALGGPMLGALNQFTEELLAGVKIFGSFREAFVEIGLKSSPFKSWGESARDLREEIAKIEADLQRLERGQTSSVGENAGGAAFVGQGSGRRASGRIAQLQAQLAGLRKRNDYFDLLTSQSIGREAARLESEYWGPRPEAPVVASGGSDKVSKEISAYERLSKAIGERLALMDQELVLGRALTDQEKFEVKVLEDLAAAKGKVSAAEVARIKTALEESKARALQLDVSRAQLKAAQDEASERQRLRIQEDQNVKQFLQEQEQAAAQRLASLRERVEGVKDETAAADLAATANIGLAEAIELVAIARAQERLERLHDDGDEAQRVRAEIAERQRLIEVLRTQRIGEKARDTIKETQAESKRFFESIYDGLSDSLFRGFEAGKGFFRSFWDGVKNTLKTTVLRVAVQGVMGMTPFAAMAGQGGGAASAAGGGGGSAVGSAIGSMFGAGGISGSMMAGAGWLTGATTLGGSLTAATSLMATGSAAGIMSGLGMVAGALGPIALGIMAIMSFVKDRGGPKADGRAGLTFSGIGDFDNSLKAGADPVQAGLQAQYDQLARALGAQAAIQFGVAFSKDPQGTSPTFLEVAGSRDGKAIFSDTNLNVGRSDEELKAALEAATTDALLKALRASNLDQPFADFFSGVAADASKQAKEAAVKTATEVASYSGSIRDLGGVFEQLTQQSVAARGALIDAAGGLQALTQSTAAYYENFYSQEEKRRITATQISRTLGDAGVGVGIDQVLGATRAQFRSLVDSLDITTEGGQKAFAALMGVAGAFASITPALDEVGSASEDAAAPVITLAEALDKLRNPLRTVEDIARSIFDLESEGQGLRAELLRAQGDGAGANALVRAIETAGFTEAEIALYDYNQALRAQIQGLRDAQEAEQERIDAAARAAAVDRERAAFEKQRAADTARGALRAADLLRGNTDAALVALQRAVEAQRRGAQAALSAAQEQRSAVQAVFGTIKSALRDLYGQSGSMQMLQAAQGRAFIEQSLGTAKATGYLPDAAELSDAIAAAVSGMNGTVYTSEFERERDRLVLAGKLSQLNDLVGPQLSNAEQQLQAAQEQVASLDEILANAQDQIDVMRGIDTGVLSVREALDRLAAALTREAPANHKEQFIETPFGRVWQSTGGAVAIQTDGGLNITGITGNTYSAEDAQAWVNDRLAQESPISVYIRANEEGISAQSLDALMAWPAGTSNDWARNVGLPAFAAGANRIPQDMLAIVHKDEAILPPAFNPWAGGSELGNSQRLERLVEGLTAQVQRLQEQLREVGTNTRRTADAVNGNPDQPVPIDLAQNSGGVTT